MLFFTISALILKIWLTSFKTGKEKNPQDQRGDNRWKKTRENLQGLSRSVEEEDTKNAFSHHQSMEKNLYGKNKENYMDYLGKHWIFDVCGLWEKGRKIFLFLTIVLEAKPERVTLC